MGGGSRRASNVLQALEKRGHKITVITAFPHYPHGKVPTEYRGKAFTREKKNGMTIFRTWVPSIPHKGFLRRLIMYLVFAFSALFVLPFSGKVDIIWAANTNIFSSFPGIFYSIFKRSPLIRNIDDLWPETAVEEGVMSSGFILRLGEFLAKIAYTLCVAITPISQSYTDNIVEKYGIPREKFRVIEHGVDVKVFRPVGMHKTLIHPLCKNRFIAMYTGVLGPGYNFDLLLRTAKLMENVSDFILVIRGFGPRALALEKIAKKMDLKNTIILTNRLSIDELNIVMSSADVLLLPMNPMPAHEAGIPTKLLEYMACSRPILVCSTGEPAFFIKRTKAGIVVNNEPLVMASAITKLKTNADLRKELGENGRKYVIKHLSIERIGQRMERLFEQVRNQ